jgi:hypothetical protein
MCIDTYSVHWKDVIVFFSFCCLGVGKMMTHCKSFDWFCRLIQLKHPIEYEGAACISLFEADETTATSSN